MKMRKSICTLLAAVFTIGMLAGCAGGSSSDAGEQFADNDETLTLKWLGYPVNPGAGEGTIPELELEEMYNVEIKPMFYEQNKFNDKKTMLMAGGEIPDLIYELDPLHVVQDVDQEFVVEVPYETIKEYAPEYYNYLCEYAPAAWIYSRYEDKNWGVPNFNHSHMESHQSIYRADWLKKFNLEVPNTLDEMHDVFYKFANEDPDGNGKKDTYGLSITQQHYHFYFSEIFGAYGVLPFDWEEQDGKIIYGGLRPETKEALKTLSTWYSEGIIHPDFLLGTSDSGLFVSGQIGYVRGSAYFDPTNKDGLNNKLKVNFPGADVAIGFLPTGPEGKAGVRAWGRACHVVSFGNTEGYGAKVPRMLKMFEGMFTDKELATKIRLGNEGEQYQAAPADTTKAQNFEFLGDYTESDARRVNGLSNDFAGPTFWAPAPVDYDTYRSTRSNAWNAYADKWLDEKYSLTDYFFKVDVVPSSADYIIDLRNKQMAVMSEIIIGDKPVDAYAEFEKEWETAGGKVMTEEANQLKDELADIYKEIGVK